MKTGRFRAGAAVALLAALAVTSAADAAAQDRREAGIEALGDGELRTRAVALLRGPRAERRSRPGERDVSAVQLLTELVARNPRSGGDQALLAFAYQSDASANPENAELALAGYDLAVRAEPNHFWANVMGGGLAYERGRYDEAAQRFAKAVLARPADGQALLGLASATYMGGDSAMAAAASNRAAELLTDPSAREQALRLAALAEAAEGEGERARVRLAALQEVSPASAARTEARVQQLEQTSAVDETAQPAEAADAPATAPRQISVDVTIVLAQNTRRERIGLNLLDGLQVNYGYNVAWENTRNRDAGGIISAGRRIITAAIGFPQLTYNLNLFNRGGQYYSVVARPQLTAFQGETSEFFVGRSLAVSVRGVNSSSLERIDIGIEMKVTPVEITTTGARLRIETGRSFLTADPAGTFAEALTTFRQRVAATADIAFGETLLLSGLSETVDDRTYSRTPVLGELPLIGSLFNARQEAQRRDAVLILVTPSVAMRLPGRPFARAGNIERLAQLWTRIVDPGSNAADVAARLGRMRMFTRMRPGDAPLNWPGSSEVNAEMLGELLAPGS